MKTKLMELSYGPYELEPYFDGRSMVVHYSQYYKTYIVALAELLEKYPQYSGLSAGELLTAKLVMPEPDADEIRYYAGGIINHELYFDGITPKKTGLHGSLGEAIVQTFGSPGSFKEIFIATGASIKGSGSVFLLSDVDGALHIRTLPDNAVPQPSVFGTILICDMWEHAYLFKHKSRVDEYMGNWFSVIDWDEAEKRYQLCKRGS